MDNCLFCEIAAGQIPCHKIYEDENVLAFLDIHPCAEGHTVVIPKKHFASVSEISDEEWGPFLLGVKRTAEKVRAVLRPDGMNIGINDGPAAGQAVPHAHWHIIPRRDNDAGGSLHSIIRLAVKDVAETAALFK